jgi:hypothetical protein
MDVSGFLTLLRLIEFTANTITACDDEEIERPLPGQIAVAFMASEVRAATEARNKMH